MSNKLAVVTRLLTELSVVVNKLIDEKQWLQAALEARTKELYKLKQEVQDFRKRD